MRKVLRRCAVTFATTISCYAGMPLVAATTAPADTSRQPRLDDLQDGLMLALGDSFEYVGGNVVAEVECDPFRKQDFWFAKVKVNRAGEYAMSYDVQISPVPASSAGDAIIPLSRDGRERVQFIFPIYVAPRGTRRFLNQQGRAWPPANQGDTVVIPILVGPHIRNPTFARHDPKYFTALWLLQSGHYPGAPATRPAAEEPHIRNDAVVWADVVSSSFNWGPLSEFDSGTIGCSYEATLQFK